LARWQAGWVSARLQEVAVEVTLVPITTSGDRDQVGPVEQIGTQGVFTKEIQRALIDDCIDLAVHSLKDLPTQVAEGIVLAAVPERESVADVLVSQKYGSFDELPKGAIVGTGSLRRQSQLLYIRRDLQLRDIRGNVDTRLRKLNEGQYDALILAEAGLRRLGRDDRIRQVLPPEIMLPAVGQGALGLETRVDDLSTRAIVARLDHLATHTAVLAERAMLAALHGGCMAPIAAWARLENGSLVLTGRVLARDGTRKLEASLFDVTDEPEALGRRVAEELLAQGAAELIRVSRHGSPDASHEADR
jgi:hydroxymethylbilane synthase